MKSRTIRSHLDRRLLVLACVAYLLQGCCSGLLDDTNNDSPTQAQAQTLIQIQPGFTPQPLLAVGSNDGTFVNALDFGGDQCRGMLRPEPQHRIVVTADIPMLFIAARGQGTDPTLVIRTPSGQSLCNDDTEGRDPLVSGPFPAGTYQVYVGSWGNAPQGPYRLGISETPLLPSALPFAPPQ